ncbi:MAG: choice-of-anchor Q domain-containing protein [Dehalococcoidia bacterium]
MKLLPLAVTALVGTLIAFGSTEATAGSPSVELWVTKLSDSADGNCSETDCSLREAIITANDYAGTKPVYVHMLAGVQVLSLKTNDPDTPQYGDLDVTKDVTIYGDPTLPTVIDANGIDRILEINCTSACLVHLAFATLRDGNSPQGMAVLVNSGRLSLGSVTLANNRGLGGALNVGGGASAIVDLSTIRNNESVGTSGEAGGGILNAGTLDVLRTTISGNTALDAGGGIANFGTLTVEASTISGNRAPEGVSFGGGVYQNFRATSATIRGSTIVNNEALTGAGIHGHGSVSIDNTIVALNVGDDCAGSVITFGNNIDSDGTCNLETAQGDIIAVDPKIGPLRNNGWFTRTHALLAGSPALENADTADCLAYDQRNVTRPQGAICDIGAYEARYCYGKPETRLGTESAETIEGTANADVILGLGGNDTLRGREGNDRLCGGAGDDVLVGGLGDDRLNGGPNDDSCTGNAGSDLFAACETTIP